MRAGAPSLLEQAERVLEWDRVVEILARRARSAMGAERCRALPLEQDAAAAGLRLQETTEMVLLRESEEPFPSLSFPDLRDSLGRVAKDAVLEAADLRNLVVVLELGEQVARYMRRRQMQAPALCGAAAPLDRLAEALPVREAIDRAIDVEGNIRESATPELHRLMQQAHALKQQMRHRLETILASSRYADVLQEHYFAQREGRYVVPIKADLRSKIPGIVHDVSASGATVFFEPRELVDLNNSIKVAELEVEREVRRILHELSAQVRLHVSSFLQGLETLALLDAIAAKAAFSTMVRGRPVALNACGRIVLRQARHPLLVLAREHVVANDIVLPETVRVLIISGPNTGGKTVTLKIVGLFALMVRAGLHLPCEPESEMALFPEIYADIGDAQDLAGDLSSFSAHMLQMIRLLDQAGQAGRSTREPLESRALVLLDEPVTSTDPAEGAALAEALLVRLSKLGMKVIATTHYNSLKALAQTTAGFLNASVEFDVSRLAPTYRLIMDVPGGSSAIEIAGRLGMEEAILDEAQQLLRREDRGLEQMLSDLQDKQRRLDDDLARIAALKAETERSAREAAEIADRLRQSEREERKSTKKKLTDDLLHARAQIQGVVQDVKGERNLEKARAAKQRLAEIEAQARERLIASGERIPVEGLKAGDSVEIVSLGATGILLEAPDKKKRVKIRVGDAELSVATSGLAGLADGGSPVPSKAGSAVKPSGVPPRRAPFEPETSSVLDVRGRTAEEAMELTIAALDRAALDGVPFLRIIHGHGTGRLKTVLRDYLKRSPYVDGFRIGERTEGGDGVTVVTLK